MQEFPNAVAFGLPLNECVIGCRGSPSRRSHSSTLHIATQRIGSLQQRRAVDLSLWLKLKIDHGLMSDFNRRKILCKETHGRTKVPGIGKIDQFFDGLVSVFLDLNIAASTINVTNRNRCITLWNSID